MSNQVGLHLAKGHEALSLYVSVLAGEEALTTAKLVCLGFGRQVARADRSLDPASAQLGHSLGRSRKSANFLRTPTVPVVVSGIANLLVVLSITFLANLR